MQLLGQRKVYAVGNKVGYEIDSDLSCLFKQIYEKCQ